ncbi:tyrosine-type recombinase/integrase [Oceanisphaera sp. IT1-181]|uniref:tyrosine-type recombinase/integrase n=1 Tax=Oceanisphaera sp. IT1-181 TaxID=3081199 RepID=UPI0029C9C63C|nr:tyrosine-type recombinase/integrase [Oceanisphaera sp. IT1-181]
MANPLILPDDRPLLVAMLGWEHRKAKRQQQDELVLRAAVEIVRRHLPQILHPSPDASGFEQAWPKIEQSLQLELKSVGAYRHAYSFLCRQLELGNRQEIWSVPVPPPYIMLRRRRPTRTLSWQQNSHLVAEAEHQWFESLHGETLEPDALFARLLLTTVLYGGLNRPTLWPALAKAINQPKPLRGDSECCWLVLEPAPGRTLASNLYREEQETNKRQPHCEVVYIPDPISLGVLRQFLKHKPHNWEPPASTDKCLALLNGELKTHLSKTQIAHGGITVAEHQQGIELPQALVEYAIGKQPSTSLPSCYWQRLLQPSLFTCHAHHFSQLRLYPNLASRRVSQPAGHHSQSYLLTRLREAFRQDPARPKSKRSIITELQTISSEELLLPEATFVNWLLNHLTERKNSESTAQRYLSSIGSDWLLATDQQDLFSYSSEDFHDLYLSMLNRPGSQKNREYRAGRLEDLHLFGVQQFGFPPIPEPLHQSTNSIVYVSAAIVDEPLFSALLGQFQYFQDLGESQQRMFICFLIMAYRTGLRPSELSKLRLLDIEPSATAWLFVRKNKHGNNKTEAALRKVPLFPLLTTEEKQLLAEYLGERRIRSNNNSTELLFYQGENPHEPLDTSSLSLAVGALLKELSGGLYFRLYHLRHSALSRMQLLLHDDYVTMPEPVNALLPYDAAQRKTIRTLITGQGRLRDRYSALAAFAGHSSPDITLSTYLHFTDLLLGLHLQHNKRPLNGDQAQALLGFRPHRIRQYFKEELPLNAINTTVYLHKRVTPYIQPISRPKSSKRTSSQSTPLLSVRKSQYEPMLAVLKKIETGYDYRETAWFYRLEPEQIQRWHQSALALRALTTDKSLPRLFPRSRRHQLLPPDPVGVAEMRDVALGIKRCRELYVSNELSWIIRYTLTHCNSSRSGIEFNDSATFQQFMVIASQIFDWSRWQLSLSYTDKKIIKQWQCGSLQIKLQPMKQNARFHQGSGWLNLRHREETQRREADKLSYSSHSLRIMLHRLAIILFTADEIATWQVSTESIDAELKTDLKEESSQ